MSLSFFVRAAIVTCALVAMNLGKLMSGVRQGAFQGAHFLGDGNDFAWGLNVFLPLMLLLWIQIRFLPYHSVGATWLHRLAIVLDALLIFFLWPQLSPGRRRVQREGWRLTMEPLLSVQDLHVFDDRGIEKVRGVSFEVRAGEVVGIAGIDGNCQTELIDAMTGLRHVDAGTVVMGGRDVTRLGVQDHFDAVVHYDLSWNPTRHEQREGRVDRFGQKSGVVRATLLYGANNPVDGAVLEVILKKADKIREELLKLKTSTAFGEYAVDERGFQIAHKMVLHQWQNGKKVTVWPANVADGKPAFPTPPWNSR